MFLWRLSPHSAPAPSPQLQAWAPPPPAMALCLFLPPKQQPTDTFFLSPPSLQAASMSYCMNLHAVILATPASAEWPFLGPIQLAVGKCRHEEGMHVFFGEKLEERM